MDYKQETLELARFSGKTVEVECSVEKLSSDGGGSLLLWLAEKAMGVLKRVADILPDTRKQDRIEHTGEEILKQRVFGIAMGYEDLSDHDALRNDPGIQMAVGKEKVLASSPTLCRFEGGTERQTALKIHRIIVDAFIESFQEAPTEIILDFDATDDRVHGNQAGAHFHAYYDSHCFLPLYVFCGQQLLVSYLRPSNKDGAHHAGVVLKLLVKRLREAWPGVRIILRGDAGFCRRRMLFWCEKHNIRYIVGLTGNNVLKEKTVVEREVVKAVFNATQEKQKLFNEFQYGAKSWGKERRVIVKAEYNEKGPNTRYVATNIEEHTAEHIYTQLYCARGEMENRIKEQQLYLFADRTSCKDWWSNQFRLMLSSLAYILLEAIRRLGLAGTAMASAQCHTIRNKLFKVAAVIQSNTRRIRFFLPKHYPYQEILYHALQTLCTLTPAPA
jgi:Transposase DDE domain group 1